MNNINWKERAEKAEAELHDTRILLYEKNTTANTFMAQVKRLQAEIHQLKQQCQEACGSSEPSAVHDWASEVCGLLRVARSQRDDAEKCAEKLQAELTHLREMSSYCVHHNDSERKESLKHCPVCSQAELDRAQRRLAARTEALRSCREMIARFLIPWRHRVTDSWLIGFEEAGWKTNTLRVF